ncbi:short-chain dehydrogenase/reductase [Rhizobium wenxiniae]|uniref:NAD(P)-dependent dehydrogenase (Short-subunit alcohol dehydrogenase family) n=1 Tax=Rhizobium wenxiniae TaxID=1737357 RepID=A0A7W9Y803_9HYPH|nr:SDR family oxidoreductase [Rhizobium wenxiniae]MBB6163695.1 NAD(P)-dependent dehydrogenase (short-subunit alcohol dehydrogenase family) [Rhizobium wenxiniae]GGG12357.1 short-chain dehydrogenase/reductase [Rhizobium wenxiniae]
MSKTWFITGINSGLGREMATQALENGDRVAGTVRKQGSVDDLKACYPDRLWVAQLDLTDIEAIEGCVKAAFAKFGSIDVIVNNAGYGLFGAAEGLSTDQIRHQIDTNLVGPIEVTRVAIPYLRHQGGGRIIAISTYGGQATHPGASLYHASKWGIEGFFDSLSQELAPLNIGVTIIEPGSARTTFREAAAANAGSAPDAYNGTPVGMVKAFLSDTSRMPVGDPEKMASAILESACETPAPRRLVLGSDAFAAIEKALQARTHELETSRAIAPTTDFR